MIMGTHVTPMTPPGPIRVDTGFGEFTVNPGDLVSFPSGLPGFERCRSFALLSSEELAPLSYLQAVGGPPASFLVIDPRQVLPDYRCALGQSDLGRLGATESSVLLWLAIVSFTDDDHAWANLRAPVVINPQKMIGYQVLPHNSLYPLRHPLTPA
jgi:flagellar assembly factor FliW